MDDELIRAHAENEKLAPYLHLPVQSGSDRVLAAMNRRHSAKTTLRSSSASVARAPDIALSSDFIVGFPGETDEDFRATLALVREVGFASAFAFKYSPRPGTPAAEDKDQLSDELKAERLAILLELLEEQRQAFNHQTVGKRFGVVFDKPGRHEGQLVGRSPYMQACNATPRFGSPRRDDRSRGFRCQTQFAERARCRAGVMMKESAVVNKPWEAPALKTSDPTLTKKPPVKRESEKRDETSNEIALAFDDNRLASIVFGDYDQNIARIERRLGVIANANGNQVLIRGPKEASEQARRVFEMLYERAKLGQLAEEGDVEGAIEETSFQGSLFPDEVDAPRDAFSFIKTRRRGIVRARNLAQDRYLHALRSYELVFAEGPAGTGKTWLAVGHAVSLLEQGIVERLIFRVPRWRRANGSASCPAT